MLPEFEKFMCWMCKHSDSCKRVDHEHIKFAHSPFAVYDSWKQHGFICSDFCTSSKEWPGFENYYHYFRMVWTYPDTRYYIGFTINNDKDTRYYVPYSLFAYNRHIDKDGNLKWHYKQYYKRSRKSPIGYELVKEINPKYERKDNNAK